MAPAVAGADAPAGSIAAFARLRHGQDDEMRIWAFLLAALLFASAACAYDYSLYLPEGTVYSLPSFPHGNGSALALYSGGKVQAFFLPGTGANASPSIVTGTGQAKAMLRSFYIYQGYSPNATLALAQVHSGIAATANSSDAGEARCRILLGTDRNGCTDMDSCQKACYSVTSFCMPIALGAGKAFISEVWRFENASRGLDGAYAAEAAAYGAISQNATSEEMEAYLLSLSSIANASLAAASSPLYYEYSYCFSPEYSLQNITLLRSAALRAWQESSRFYSIDEEALAIGNRTAAAILARESFVPKGSFTGAKAQGANSALPDADDFPPEAEQQGRQAAMLALPFAAVTCLVLLSAAAAVAAGRLLAVRRQERGKGGQAVSRKKAA